jgi:hypothetical protein
MPASIVITKDLLWKGIREQFSNRWHLEGDSLPTTLAEFNAFAGAWIAAEKPTVPPEVRFVRALWYTSDDGDAVFSYAPEDFNGGNYPAGTLAVGTSIDTPSESVVRLRHKTTKMANGRPVYLIHYLHGARADGSDADTVFAAQRTAVTTFGTKLIDGTLSGTIKLCGPDGADASLPVAAAFISTRQLRKGRRRTPTS